MATGNTHLFGMRRKRLLSWLPEVVIGGLLVAVYVVYLNAQDGRVARHFEQVRESDPEIYLDEVRVVQGFSAYLRAYGDIHGAGAFTQSAPGFLLGRWALFDHPLRVGDRFSTTACLNAVLVENGRLTLPGAKAPVGAEYWLSKDRVIVRLKTGTVFTVRLIGSGVFLHHLEFDRSNGGETEYGYRCK